MPCHAMLCYTNAMPCHAMPCHAMPCHAMPCHAMPCHATLCHAMLCYAMLCYTMLTILYYSVFYYTLGLVVPALCLSPEALTYGQCWAHALRMRGVPPPPRTGRIPSTGSFLSALCSSPLKLSSEMGLGISDISCSFRRTSLLVTRQSEDLT